MKVLKTVPGRNGRTYEIREGDDGVTYCTCPAWRFRKKCKHLRNYTWKETQAMKPIQAMKPTPTDNFVLSNAVSQAISMLGQK